MKQLTITISILLFLSFAIHSPAAAQKNKDDKAAQIKTLVQSQEYVFTVQNVQTMRGTVNPALNLTGYDLTITSDSVIAYLPYFGRAYTAPADPTLGGIKFSSADFDYNVDKGKKGGWDVQIKPHDVDDIQQLYLTVTSDGYATLQVVSISRETITYLGKLEKRK